MNEKSIDQLIDHLQIIYCRFVKADTSANHVGVPTFSDGSLIAHVHSRPDRMLHPDPDVKKGISAFVLRDKLKHTDLIH